MRLYKCCRMRPAFHLEANLIEIFDFVLQVRNQLLDSAKLHKDVKNSPELSVYYKILKLKVYVCKISTGYIRIMLFINIIESNFNSKICLKKITGTNN